MAALPPSVSQVPGKNLCFLVSRVSERNMRDPEHVVIALTRLRDFLVKEAYARFQYRSTIRTDGD